MEEEKEEVAPAENIATQGPGKRIQGGGGQGGGQGGGGTCDKYCDSGRERESKVDL